MYEHMRQKDFFWGALVGGTVATLTALLFTTKKGRQIQHQIGEIYRDVEDSIKYTVSESQDKVSHAAQRAGRAVKRKAPPVKHTSSAQKTDSV